MSDLAAAYFADQKFAPVRPLLVDLLPGIPRADMACAIVGELMRRVPLLCRQHRCQLAYYQVAMIMLGHSGYHSNRVWCSQLHIAQKAIEMFGWKGTPESVLKTVQRAIDFWCVKFPIFRKITDQDELLSGPGEWQYVDSGKKKRGKNQTNHYDTKGVAPFAPTNYAGALDALITGEQYKPAPTPEPMRPIDVDERYPYPFTDAEESAESRDTARTVSIRQGNDELTEAGFEVPFYASVETFAEDAVPAKNAVLTVQAPSSDVFPVFDKKDISNISPRPRNVEMSDKYGEASSQEKTAEGPAALNHFPETNLSGITIKYGASVRPPTQAPIGPQKCDTKRNVKRNIAHPTNRPPEVVELHRRGVDEGMAVTMFKKMKAKLGDREKARRWLRQVLTYGKWADAETGETHGGRWYNGIFKNWHDGKLVDGKKEITTSWPDEAMDAINREEAAYNKSAEGRLSREREWGYVPSSPATPAETPQKAADAPFELSPPLLSLPTEFDSFLTYKPASAVEAAPPSPSPTAAPPELLAAWPAVRKEAGDFLPAALRNLVGQMKPLGMETGADGSALITLGTAMRFAKKTFDDKPQQVQMLSHLFADALGLNTKAVAVQIVVSNPAADATSVSSKSESKQADKKREN